jgi:hypothetical protein
MPRLAPDVISRGRAGFALVLGAGKDPLWAALPGPRNVVIPSRSSSS